jgi:hypothetical protein
MRLIVFTDFFGPAHLAFTRALRMEGNDHERRWRLTLVVSGMVFALAARTFVRNLVLHSFSCLYFGLLARAGSMTEPVDISNCYDMTCKASRKEIHKDDCVKTLVDVKTPGIGYYWQERLYTAEIGP